MSVRQVRVVLVAALLAVWMGTLGSATAAAPQRELPDFSDLEGLGPAGHTRTLYPSLLDSARDADASFRTPQVIVGPDTRTQVVDTAQFPYSAIANLELYEAGEDEEGELIASCTGSLVGPNVVMTAAHCLWDDDEFGGWIDGVAVVPGANGETEPFGFDVGITLWVPDPYPDNSQPGSPWDYGLIVLANDDLEEATGSFELGILTTVELQDPNFTPTTSGYPGDKPFATQWISSEQAFISVTDDELQHSIDSFQGQSGSPIWRGSDTTVVAVESSETETDNFAIRLDLPVIYELLAACRDLGCHLNHYLTDVPGEESAYDSVWQRTDQPVLAGAEARTWMWGPAPVTKIMLEPYDEAPNGFRPVLYHEKSRMEITHPNVDPSSIWYVTNGLATVELMTGMLQLGNNTFEEHNPAEINVAGDSTDPNGPTYVTFAGLQTLPPHGSAAETELAGAPVGPIITATVDRAGTIGDDPSLAQHGVTAAQLVPETNHSVASVFWEFMNSSGTVWQDGQFVDDLLFENPFFATGFPVTEAYWATVQVGGTPRIVLVQAFQRRILTYTPGNPAGFEVEAGNVGLHYQQWRYELIPAEGAGEPVDPPPAIGDLLFGTDLSNTPPIETEFGDVGTPLESSYQISNPAGGLLPIFGEEPYGDAYYSLDVRLTQSSPSALGCLMLRLTVDEEQMGIAGGYWLCLAYEGDVLASIDFVFLTPQSVIVLAGWVPTEPLPANEWRQIGVVAQGQKFWVVVDDLPIGSLVHDIGPSAGLAGLLAFNAAEEGPNTVFELTNFEIYALAAEAT